MKLLTTFFCIIFLLIILSTFAQTASQLEGAWEGKDGVYTFADGYYSYASFTKDEFLGTHGGKYEISNGQLNREIEYNTFDNDKVGSSINDKLSYSKKRITINGKEYSRFDDGSPGALHGAWLITGRMQDGEIQERSPGPRKTMKILSGKRFQWIAYNTETKEFMGTGGGTYTTVDGKYTENIEFFSRDQSRVGASLPFDYELKDGKWYHSGKSSKGDPIYEVWSRRSEIE